MRQLLEDCPAERFVDSLGLEIRRDGAVLGWRRAPATRDWLGPLPQRQGMAWGVAPPLGRLTPVMLRSLARLARDAGDGSLRVSPWQSLVLPNVDLAMIDRAELNCLGLIWDAGQPLARLTACTGAAGCAKALADTKADALIIASLLQKVAPAVCMFPAACVPVPWLMSPRPPCWPALRAVMTCICATRTSQASAGCVRATFPRRSRRHARPADGAP